MLRDVVSFSSGWRAFKRASPTPAIASFVAFMERRLGGAFAYDVSAFPYGAEDLADLFGLAEDFRRRGIIASYSRGQNLADEPKFPRWQAAYADTHHGPASGMATNDERQALTATLAETIERYVWFHATDYFQSPQKQTASAMAKRGAIMAPERFAGFSNEQRAADPLLTIKPESEYLWIRGRSWVSGKKIWIPAQVVSGKYGAENMRYKKTEPVILSTITTGLATGVTQRDAILGGILEILERDAFMIMWLNQLSLPRLDLDALALESDTFAMLLAKCRRYRLQIDAVRLITDAPTYAVCAVVRDAAREGVAFAIGLKANRSPARAVEGALLEALRMRQNVRNDIKRGTLDESKVPADIVHLEHATYWALGDRAQRTAFMTTGPVEKRKREVWEDDTASQHLDRILAWCCEKGYGCASVDLGRSHENISPWKIEMVVMPEMQPLHQTERLIYLGGERLVTIPKMFGHQPRPTPFADEPHPFA